MHGTYEEIDGRPVLRFERRLAHPVERVWRAVTEPSELAHWFPAGLTIDMRVGGRVQFTFPDGAAPPMEGEVMELGPPRVFAFTWEDDLLKFELEPVEDGCLLRFTHVLAQRDQGAMVAAGWSVCFEELDKQLAGEPAHAPDGRPTDKWRKYYGEYQERGVPSGAPVPG
jgi:uncharacterized protein YndB with AHSA1/START domain